MARRGAGARCRATWPPRWAPRTATFSMWSRSVGCDGWEGCRQERLVWQCRLLKSKCVKAAACSRLPACLPRTSTSMLSYPCAGAGAAWAGCEAPHGHQAPGQSAAQQILLASWWTVGSRVSGLHPTAPPEAAAAGRLACSIQFPIPAAAPGTIPHQRAIAAPTRQPPPATYPCSRCREATATTYRPTCCTWSALHRPTWGAGPR